MSSLIGNTNSENGRLIKQGSADGKVNGIGRPKVSDRPGFEKKCDLVYGCLDSGDVTVKDAAGYLGIGTTTLRRLLRQAKNSDLRSLRQQQSDRVNA